MALPLPQQGELVVVRVEDGERAGAGRQTRGQLGVVHEDEAVMSRRQSLRHASPEREGGRLHVGDALSREGRDRRDPRDPVEDSPGPGPRRRVVDDVDRRARVAGFERGSNLKGRRTRALGSEHAEVELRALLEEGEVHRVDAGLGASVDGVGDDGRYDQGSRLWNRVVAAEDA